MFRSSIIGALLAALALLSGCSTLRFAYHQAPDLAYWWLDGYVDFNDSQSPPVRDAIAGWFSWHRRTQLSDYAMLLARAQAQVVEPVTPAQVCRWVDDVSSRFDMAIDQALVLGADTAISITPEQIRHLQRKYRKNNEKFASDFLQPTAEERTKASVKRSVERAESLYGWLEEAQQERIVQGMASSPFDPNMWLAERKARQHDVLQTLQRLVAERAAPDNATAAMRALYQRIRTSPRAAYRAYEQRLMQYNCAFAAQIHNLATPSQRQQAARKLKGWEEDLRALADNH